MSAALSSGQRYTSGFHVRESIPLLFFFKASICKVLRTTSPRNWYRGFFPQWGRIAPYTILQFYFWEKLCNAFDLKAV